jgi:hypothetical protein
MTSHSRRPAATDYFNPTEQIEILQNIKARAEKSATSTPQESYHIDSAPRTGTKTVDFKAHELSLREKLEKAKADREAKAKADATLKVQTTDATQPKLVENQSNTETLPAGPPPPPVLNTTPTPAAPVPYSQTWNPNVAFSAGIPNYGRPPYPYPQPYPQQYGMPPYPNGQPAHTFAQWGQYTPTPSTPGIPPPPPQPNQGPPTSQSNPNPIPMNQSSPGL